MSAAKRIVEVDILRAMAIAFVVLGHVLMVTPTGWFLRDCIYSFHMPLFFILSGFVTASSFEAHPDVWRKVRKSTRRLLVPYVVCGLLIMPVVNTLLTGQPEPSFIEGWKNAFVRNRFLWYLPCCFFLNCCFVVGRPLWRLIVLVAVLGIVYWLFPQIDYIRSVLSYIIPFFTGVFLFHHADWMLKPSGRAALVSSAALVAIAVGFALLGERTLGAHLLRSMGGLAAVLPLAFVAERAARHPMLGEALAIPGRNTLFTYCFDFCAAPIAMQFFAPSNLWQALAIGFGIVVLANLIVLGWGEMKASLALELARMKKG